MQTDDATPTTESPLSPDTGTPSYSLLAGEMFGQKYKGKAPEAPEPAPVPEEPQKAASEDADEPVTLETSPDESSDPDAVKTAAEPQEEVISSLGELVEHYKFDPDWIESIKVPVKIDGREGEATLSDLRKSYQIQEAAERRLEEAKLKAKTQQQELTQKGDQLNTQFATVAELIKNAEAFLDTETGSINWDQLRSDDPAEYSAKKQDIKERREKLDQMKQNAAKTFQESVQRQQQEMQAQMQGRLQNEHAALIQKLPEWRDTEKATAEKAKLADYLMTQAGFSQDDVMAASDHRLVVLARKAMLFDELKAKTNAAEKKVAKVPKVFKPGTPKPQDQINRERVDRSQQKLRQSGKLSDAVAYLKERRGQT